MGDYFNYYPLELRGVEKFFFRSIIFSSRVILIVTGLAFLSSGIPIIKVLGFWLVIVFSFLFLRGKYWSISDTRGSKSKNLADYFNFEALDLIFDIFKDLENINIGPPRAVLLLKLSSGRGVKEIIKKLNINPVNFKNEIAALIETQKELPEIDVRKTVEYFIKENLLPVFIRAREIAKSLSMPCISCEILFAAVFECEDFETSDILNKFGLIPEYIRSALVSSLFKKSVETSSRIQPSSKFIKPFYGIKPSLKRIMLMPMPFLDKFGTDLTYIAKTKKIGFLIGHRKEIGEINSIFNKDIKSSVVLYGENGSGKNSIVWYLSWLVANGLTIDSLHNKKIIQIDLDALYLKNPVDFNKILKGVCSESLNSSNAILYFKNIENIFFIVGESLLSIIQPFLSNGLSVITTTTSAGLQELYQFDIFKKYLKAIEVEELTFIEAVSVLTLESKFLEKKYKISISPQALYYIVSLSKKYFPEKLLPKSAIESMNAIFSFAAKEKIKIITEEMVGDKITKT